MRRVDAPAAGTAAARAPAAIRRTGALLPKTVRRMAAAMERGIRTTIATSGSAACSLHGRQEPLDVGGLVVVHGPGTDRPVRPQTQEAVELPGVVVAVPDRDLR